MLAGPVWTVIPWTTILWIAIFGYAVSVAIFLVLENRTPQSTFAWLFLLLIFPFGGLTIYFMFGRNRHAFSNERRLVKLVERTGVAERARQVMDGQPQRLSQIREGLDEYGRLAGMLWTTARSPLTRSNRVEILQNASEKYPRLLADMRAAKRSIHLLYYEWASDPFTDQVADILAQRVKEGVQVRILYDPVGSFFMLRRSYITKLRRQGVRMYPFSPSYLPHTLSYRNHRKIAVIDGCIGYSGGMNMTEKHLTGVDGFSGWRDTHARVTGEAVEILQVVFATMWQNTTKEDLFDDVFFPVPVIEPQGVPIQVVSAGPDSRWEAIRQSYLAMIALANDHVYLQSPFLIPDVSVAEALKTAALSGLDVRVMIAPRGAEFSPAYRAGMTYAADMVHAGVKVLLYQGEYFHSKTVCIDSILCSIGSANMDIRSFSINYETNLVIYDQAVSRELEADFFADQENCVPFSAGEYERRAGMSRLVDSMLRLCSPLL
jgi:cardiolipin synthase